MKILLSLIILTVVTPTFESLQNPQVCGTYYYHNFSGKITLKLKNNGSFIEKTVIPKDGRKYKIAGSWTAAISNEKDTIIKLYNTNDSLYMSFVKRSEKIIRLASKETYDKK